MGEQYTAEDWLNGVPLPERMQRAIRVAEMLAAYWNANKPWWRKRRSPIQFMEPAQRAVQGIFGISEIW